MRGDYVAVCIYQFPPFIPDKNKHELSDQTYNCPHNALHDEEPLCFGRDGDIEETEDAISPLRIRLFQL